jgi:hypothetical protein
VYRSDTGRGAVPDPTTGHCKSTFLFRATIFLREPDALRSGIIKHTAMMKVELKQTTTNSDAALHLCLDMCTSSNQFSFLAITAHHIDSDWTLVEKLLAFQDTIDHSGVGMAALVKSALDGFELSARFGCLTMDNASNNDTCGKF